MTNVTIKGEYIKINTGVSIPRKLDLSISSEGIVNYDLYGIISHFTNPEDPTINKGHYKSYVIETDKMVEFDDKNMKLTRSDQIENKIMQQAEQCVLLMYKRSSEKFSNRYHVPYERKRAIIAMQLEKQQIDASSLMDLASLRTLMNSSWLNGVVIDCFLNSFKSNSTNSFFEVIEYHDLFHAKYIPRQLLSRYETLLNKHILLVPMNEHKMHWCLGVIFPKIKMILYCNSK